MLRFNSFTVSIIQMLTTVNVLKFRMLVPFLNDQGKANKADQDQTASAVRSGSSLFAVLTCKHFVNSSLDNQYFI